MPVIFHIVHGDIFKSEAECLVNPVNTKGISGKGLALEFKKRFFNSYKTYHDMCIRNMFHIGNILTTKENGKHIVFFPTKDNWKNPSKLGYIQKGLLVLVESFVGEIPYCHSIAIPPLGCGLGGLNWSIVKEEILRAFRFRANAILANVNVYLYEPYK